MLLDDCIAHHARYQPHKAAMIFGPEQWTYAQFDERINRCANALVKLGVRHGDRVALVMANSPWFMVVLFATARLGAVFVPCNYRLAGRELVELMEHALPRVLLGEARYLGPLLESGYAPPGGHAITVGEEALAGCERLVDLVAAASTARPVSRVKDTDPVLLQYTSGTTAKPKGVLSSHAAWTQSCLIQSPLKRVFNGSMVMTVMPMCHTGGTKWTLETLFPGATSVILERFDVDAVLAGIEQHRVTNIGLVPTQFYQLLDAQDRQRRSLSSLRYVNYGGAPMSKQRLRQAIDLLKCELTQGYGMTEMAGGSITFSAPEDHLRDGVISDKLTSVGRPLIDCQVRLLGEDGQPVAPGEPGEVLVKSTRTLLGYWGEPADAVPIDAEGFYHTGDIAREDADGYLFIVDRKKDMIVSGGLNIYSKEVEDAIQQHTAVAEAYVIGVPDETWGESVRAFVVLHSGQSVTAEEIREWCRARIASYKKPREVIFVGADELPRTAMGKVQKRLLRERFQPTG